MELILIDLQREDLGPTTGIFRNFSRFLQVFLKTWFPIRKLELLPPISSYNQYFLVLKVSMRVNFYPNGFFIVGSWAEKSWIYCR